MSPLEVRATPRSHEASRGLYESAVRNGDHYRVASIEVDTVIDSARQMFLSGRIEGREAFEALMEFSENVLTNTSHKHSRESSETMTDLNRLVNGASFITERFLAPIAYSLETNHMDSLRGSVSNGTVGKSVEILETLLDSKFEARMRGMPQQAMNHIVGAIHENTVLALMNTEESDFMVTLPSSTADDILHRTDLDYYLYNHAEETGYKLGISVKSSLEQKYKEKQQHPHDIVICAADIENRDFGISNLLIRKFRGSPGLSDEEEMRLWTVYCSLGDEISKQISNARSATLMLPQNFDKSKLITLAA